MPINKYGSRGYYTHQPQKNQVTKTENEYQPSSKTISEPIIKKHHIKKDNKSLRVNYKTELLNSESILPQLKDHFPVESDCLEILTKILDLAPETDIKNKILLSNVLKESNLISRIYDSNIEENLKFLLIRKLVDCFSIIDIKEANKDEKEILNNLLISLSPLDEKAVEIHPSFFNLFEEHPFSKNKKIVVYIGVISGGGDINLGMKTANILIEKYGRENVSVVIEKIGDEESINIDLITAHYPHIQILSKEEIKEYSPNLIFMVPARTTYTEDQKKLYDPNTIRLLMGLNEKVDFIGMTEYSKLNSEAKLINNNTEIIRSGFGRKNSGVFLSNKKYNEKEKPLRENYYFGYSAHPNTQLKFVQSIIKSNKQPNYTFVFPGKLKKYLNFYENNPGWYAALEKIGASEYIFEDIDGSTIRKFNVDNNPSGPKVTIKTGSLSNEDFLRYGYFSNDIVLMTGDQSTSEMIGMGKFICYEELPHKKLLPVDFFLQGKEFAQYYNCRIEGLYPRPRKEVDEVDSLICELTSNQERSDGKPNIYRMLYNPEEAFRVYNSSTTRKKDYKIFLDKIHKDNDIQKNILLTIRKMDIRKSLS